MLSKSSLLPAGPSRILVRGVNWLGDAVMTIPALLRLREARPSAEIALLSPSKLGELWRDQPFIDTVLAFEPGESIWQVGRRLREKHFEIALVLPNSFRSAFEIWLARIPIRIGFRSQLRSRFLTHAVESGPQCVRMRKRSANEIRKIIRSLRPSRPSPLPSSAHHLHRYLRLVGCLGARTDPLAPRLLLGDAEVRAFERRWNLVSSPAQPVFGLNPGAEYGPAKRWPPDRFIAAAIALQKLTDCHWIIFGGVGDAELAARISAGIQQAASEKSRISNLESEIPSVLNLAGRTTLRELCAGLKTCRVLLTNDSGPMHVAAAVGTRVVTLFGSTSPELTGPGFQPEQGHWVLRADVPCSPCFLRRCPIDHRCMADLAVSQVVEAVMAAFEAPGRHER
ncbi:MAG: lipopolysaccharide heptosyltransferase II [Verrucomicrobia bacterium]|nr:lipopolysaccharide heptosyltransferase II [Verrucomicrobiota bacterium]